MIPALETVDYQANIAEWNFALIGREPGPSVETLFTQCRQSVLGSERREQRLGWPEQILRESARDVACHGAERGLQDRIRERALHPHKWPRRSVSRARATSARGRGRRHRCESRSSPGHNHPVGLEEEALRRRETFLDVERCDDAPEARRPTAPERWNRHAGQVTDELPTVPRGQRTVADHETEGSP